MTFCITLEDTKRNVFFQHLFLQPTWYLYVQSILFNTVTKIKLRSFRGQNHKNIKAKAKDIWYQRIAGPCGITSIQWNRWYKYTILNCSWKIKWQDMSHRVCLCGSFELLQKICPMFVFLTCKHIDPLSLILLHYSSTVVIFLFKAILVRQKAVFIY